MTAATRRRAESAVLPYRYLCAYNRKRGMWEVVVRVRRTGEQVTCAYYQQPSDDAERIAARLYGLQMHRTEENRP